MWPSGWLVSFASTHGPKRGVAEHKFNEANIGVRKLFTDGVASHPAGIARPKIEGFCREEVKYEQYYQNKGKVLSWQGHLPLCGEGQEALAGA